MSQGASKVRRTWKLKTDQNRIKDIITNANRTMAQVPKAVPQLLHQFFSAVQKFGKKTSLDHIPRQYRFREKITDVKPAKSSKSEKGLESKTAAASTHHSPDLSSAQLCGALVYEKS